MTTLLLLSLFMVLPIMIALSALSDVYYYMIPNYYSLIVILGFYLFALINPSMNFDIILDHTLAGLLMLGIVFILFCCGIMGGGDAKIIAATSLWFGWQDFGRYSIYIILAGGVISVFFLIWRCVKPFEFYKNFPLLNSLYYGPEYQKKHSLKKRAIPYALAIAIGFFVTLPESAILNQNFLKNTF